MAGDELGGGGEALAQDGLQEKTAAKYYKDVLPHRERGQKISPLRDIIGTAFRAFSILKRARSSGLAYREFHISLWMAT